MAESAETRGAEPEASTGALKVQLYAVPALLPLEVTKELCPIMAALVPGAAKELYFCCCETVSPGRVPERKAQCREPKLGGPPRSL